MSKKKPYTVSIHFDEYGEIDHVEAPVKTLPLKLSGKTLSTLMCLLFSKDGA